MSKNIMIWDSKRPIKIKDPAREVSIIYLDRNDNELYREVFTGNGVIEKVYPKNN